MESYLKNKLSTSNPIIIAQIVSKLIDLIKEKQSFEHEIPELTYLKEQCLSSNNAVSIVAAEGIVQVIRSADPNDAKKILADLIPTIKISKTSSWNIAFLLNNLLLIELENELKLGNQCRYYNLRLPQHPFIKLLDDNSKFWNAAFKEIDYTYKISNENMWPHYNKLYKPLFLYVLCSPHEDNLTTFKRQLWNLIIQNQTISVDKSIIFCLLSWMQLERRDIHVDSECRGIIQLNSDFLIELGVANSSTEFFDHNLLLLWQAASLHQLIINNFDPRSMLLAVRENVMNGHSSFILTSVLLILLKSISYCPCVYLLKLLRLCKLILQQKIDCDIITANTVKASLLPWLTNSSNLALDAVEVANQIFAVVSDRLRPLPLSQNTTKFSNKFHDFIGTNSDVYFSVQLTILLESWKSTQDILIWLKELEKTPSFFLLKLTDFLFGMFLAEFSDNEITLKVFELIMQCIDCNNSLAANVLTLILYKLSNTADSKIHYELLKALPKMAVLKDNVQKIVATILALSKGRKVLKTFSTTLLLDLWKVENKCYTHLENALTVPYDSHNFKWEFYVTRAHVLKELCTLKPELYGTDMVAHLSKILNECKNADGALASALAIDGITQLCKHEIVDAVTTWASLSPMFENEIRIPVIKSLCSLISEFSTLDDNSNLIEEVISKLWHYTLINTDNEVWKAALDALSAFDVEDILRQMPDEYFDEETLNLKNNNQMIPGQYWVYFMKSCDRSKLQVVGDFLIKMVSLEIAAYLKFVYQVKGTREPVDYSYLPVTSVVRGISTHIKSKMFKWKGNVYKELYLECLRIFSEKYSKPLPPLDWCFLQELVHEEEAKHFCINIASHQVVLSGTARRFMVNYIEALTESYTNNEDVLIVYSNLKYLANSVQPFTLKPFLEGTFYAALALYKISNKKEQLTAILNHLSSILLDENIQESNKFVVAHIISTTFSETDMSSELFELLLDCVVSFPVKCVNDVSSPKCIKEVRTEWLEKAVRVRCELAIKSDNGPLNWLNELMEVGASHPTVTPFMLEQFARVFQKHKDNTDCVLWVHELIGQIQAAVAEKMDEKEITFMCKVFILATICFSGHFVLLKQFPNCEEMYRMFPRAIATLLEVNQWSICTIQILEWFYHMKMNTGDMFNDDFKNVFVQGLQTLRNDDEFHKYMKWIKYLNVDC